MGLDGGENVERNGRVAGDESGAKEEVEEGGVAGEIETEEASVDVVEVG